MREHVSLVAKPAVSPPEWRRLAPRLRRAWESFVVDGANPSPEIVRPTIASRWRAAVVSGIDPSLPRVPLVATEEQLEPILAEDDFASAGRRVLDDMAAVVAENEHALFLTDAAGCVLHVTGEPSVVEALRDLNARSGGRWDEAVAGPNGMGTALLTATPSVVFGAEHFCERWHSWVCYGAPIRDPVHGQILGVLNLTGWAAKAKANQLPLVIGLARSVEYLLIGSRSSWHAAVLDLGRELAARYPADGVVLCDGAARALHADARARDLLQRIGVRLDHLLGDTAVRRLLREGVDGAVAELALGDGLRVVLGAIDRGRRRLGAALLLQPRDAGGSCRSDAIDVDPAFAEIAGDHPTLQTTIRLAARAARSDETVLVTGETGTGKGLLAAAIHRASPRAKGPFVPVDCAALPRDLAESELFGYEPGAFTGAQGSGKRGRFELAERGTLFLDEIGELPLDLQAKILRALEDHSILRLGGSRPRPIDVRLLAATNRDLERAVAAGSFRLDLYHRLAVLEVGVPPLRERGDDVVRLFQRFLEEACARARRARPRLSRDAEGVLRRYSWPGNVRELRNVAAHVAHWSDGEVLVPSDLPPRVLRTAEGARPAVAGSLRALQDDLLARTLDDCGGNTSAAARALGIHRSTIYRRMRRLRG
jgi:transcriptional regulator of acetoin/glycerol metabolism